MRSWMQADDMDAHRTLASGFVNIRCANPAKLSDFTSAPDPSTVHVAPPSAIKTMAEVEQEQLAQQNAAAAAAKAATVTEAPAAASATPSAAPVPAPARQRHTAQPAQSQPQQQQPQQNSKPKSSKGNAWVSRSNGEVPVAQRPALAPVAAPPTTAVARPASAAATAAAAASRQQPAPAPTQSNGDDEWQLPRQQRKKKGAAQGPTNDPNIKMRRAKGQMLWFDYSKGYGFIKLVRTTDADRVRG